MTGLRVALGVGIVVMVARLVVAATAQPAAAPGAAAEPVAASETTAPETPAAGATAEPAAPPTEQGFNLKLRNIEERVNELKEKIFQSKARLIQLQEVVLHGAVAGAKAVLVHRNEMGSTFRLTRAQYALDGAPIFNRVDTGEELDAIEELEIFNGSIAPGNHQISVYLEYKGHGFGVFSYLKGYTFKVKSSFTFDAVEGKETRVKIVGHEQGGITAELKDRPAVRYDLETAQLLRPPSAASDATPAGEAAPATSN